MQTWHPFPDYGTTAAVLHLDQLRIQRSDTLKIMTALMIGRGETGHPATRIWRRYEWSLLEYQYSICLEWLRRDQHDRHNILVQTEDMYYSNIEWVEPGVSPAWLMDGRLHMSHQSNLIRLRPDHYRSYFDPITDNFEMYWPGLSR